MALCLADRPSGCAGSGHGARRGNPANFIDLDGRRPDRDIILGITTDATRRAALHFEAATDVSAVWDAWGIVRRSILHSRAPYLAYMHQAYTSVAARRGEVYFYLGEFDHRQFLREISDIPIHLNVTPEKVAFSRNLAQLVSKQMTETIDNRRPKIVRFDGEMM